jgi:hypothetical protein|tara:strand:+ start:297 stop:503 length:207 start_codon:yes stop_codon:yes gene_type:complete
MKQIRVGDRVKAFLDARIIGEVIEIFLKPAIDTLMVGGIPPSVAYAKVQIDSGQVVVVRTTELAIHNV